MSRAFLLRHRLVQVGIERRAGRVLPLDAVAFKDGQEVALDALQALAQPGDDLGLTR